MKQISTALVFAGAMLVVAWLGSREIIAKDMASTLVIVLPALWVASTARGGLCRRRSEAA